jgi:uncharacterized damage-inducible protein DinB
MKRNTNDIDPVDRALEAWRVHGRINGALIAAIPQNGFGVRPSGSRGRTVLEQLAHMNHVREGWVHYHKTGKYPSLGGVKGTRIGRARLAAAFEESGRGVEEVVRGALEGSGRVRMFHGNPLRWMSYLISHESHHRGQILLALKQSKMTLPPKIAMMEMWQSWISG